MSKIVINELWQNPELLQTLAVEEADRVVGGVSISISSTVNPGAFSSSSSSRSAGFSTSINEGGVIRNFGFSFATRSENGVQLERKFEKFGNFPDNFVFPEF
jgi:hypothetical protein